MKICCISDIHGYFPDVPDCDLLLLGGDYCPVSKRQYFWFRDEFKPWLFDIASRDIPIIGVAGNHDWAFVREKELLPRMDWEYLEDSGTTCKGYNIWGSPWQKPFYNWAFNMEESQLYHKWQLIPEYTDILLLHGPPFGWGDVSPYSGENCGSPSLNQRILEIKPKLVVFGHIHDGYGVYNNGDTLLVNASHVNEHYKPVNSPIIVEI